jgi:hypothetical protein
MRASWWLRSWIKNILWYPHNTLCSDELSRRNFLYHPIGNCFHNVAFLPEEHCDMLKDMGDPLGIAGFDCIHEGVKMAVDLFCEVGCGYLRLVVFLWCVLFPLVVFVHRQVDKRGDSSKGEGIIASV